MAHRLDADHTGSGTYAGDEYRGSVGQGAAILLDKGLGADCLSADHSGANELCVETIVRKASDGTKQAKWVDGTNRGLGVAQRAADKVRSGLGVHKKQSDHSGNTCAEVIAAAT